MNKLFILTFFLIALTLTSCSSTTKLYEWRNYEDSSYRYLKAQTPEAQEDLMKTYKTMIGKSKGSRAVVPPGIYAEYGYLLIMNGKREEGVQMLEKEKELYPESTVFMNRLIKQFS